MTTKSDIYQLSSIIIGCAIEVNKHIGPGLLESVYMACMKAEMRLHNLSVQSEVYVPIKYKDVNLGGVLKIDLLVNDLIIVELKSVEAMIPLYKAQLLSYMKLAEKPKGLLINFNSEKVKDNITSLVTESFRELPN